MARPEKGMPVEVIIAFGSNLGDRRANVRGAIRILSEKGLEVTGVSAAVRTRPAEGVAGGFFLNGVLVALTELEPGELLALLQETEQEMGRPAGHAPGTARTMDLDIIYYGDLVCDRPGLRVPHPGRLARAFVIGPAAEVAPGFVDPVYRKSLERLRDEPLPGKGRETQDGL